MAVVTVTLHPCIDVTFSVQRIVPGRKLTAEDVREYPGGGGLNVARVVTRLGGEVRALWTSGGESGQRLAQMLDAEAVAHTPVPVHDRVRENLIATDASTGEQYRFGMPGPTLTDEERARWSEHLAAVPHSTEYVVFSGSLPGGVSPEHFGELLRSLPGSARIVVDTKGEALRRALDAGVYLIKPNVHELEELVGRELADDEDIEEAARSLIRGGRTHAVVVSLGRAGAALVTAEETERYAAPLVPARSRVGAGDSLVGGLVAALDRGEPLGEAARWGVAAGTAAVLSEGTRLCEREDVERLLPKVRRQEPGDPQMVEEARRD